MKLILFPIFGSMMSHPISSIPFFTAVAFERAGYYGLRAIFVLFLVNSSIGLTNMEAIQFYAWGTGLVALSSVFGGLLGLIGQPKLLSIIGIGLQVLSSFLIGMSQTKELAFTGFALLALGAGIARSNIMPFLGQLYQRSRLLDSGMMINYMMVNIGAFAGIALISSVAIKQGYKMAFIYCGFAYLLSFIALFFTNETKNDPVHKPEKPNNLFPIILVVALIGSAFYWLSFERVIVHLTMATHNLDTGVLSELIKSGGSNLNLIVIVATTLVLALYYSYSKISTALQLGIGFLCALIAYLFLLPIDFYQPESAPLVNLLLGFYILQSIAEVFIGPPISSYVVRKLDVKYSPIVLGGIYLLIALILKAGANNDYGYVGRSLNIALVIMILFSAAFFVLFYINKKSDPIDFEEDDFGADDF